MISTITVCPSSSDCSVHKVSLALSIDVTRCHTDTCCGQAVHRSVKDCTLYPCQSAAVPCSTPQNMTGALHHTLCALCRVLYCTVLHCTVLYCTVLYCTVLYCTVLYCTVHKLWSTKCRVGQLSVVSNSLSDPKVTPPLALCPQNLSDTRARQTQFLVFMGCTQDPLVFSTVAVILLVVRRHTWHFIAHFSDTTIALIILYLSD